MPTFAITPAENYAGLVVFVFPENANRAVILHLVEAFLEIRILATSRTVAIAEAGRVRDRARLGHVILGMTPEQLRLCRRMSRRAGSSFHAGFRLLPAQKRRAMEALYAFLRFTDDLADGPATQCRAAKRSAAWRRGVERPLTTISPLLLGEGQGVRANVSPLLSGEGQG